MKIDNWNNARALFKNFIHAVKPWKMHRQSNEGQRYVEGWNACIKELNKREKEWFYSMDFSLGNIKHGR